jgi:hypothetical protein
MEISECAGNISKISMFFDVLRKKALIQIGIGIGVFGEMCGNPGVSKSILL